MARRPRTTDDTAVADVVRRQRRRLDKLEMPDGNQLGQALTKVNNLISNIGSYVNAYLAGGFTAATAVITGVFKNPFAYSNPISTSFRNVFVTSVDGQFGFNLSSGRFKRDIQTARVSATDVLKLRLVTFRYIAAVEEFGEAAALEHGFIAEEVEEAGLGWLVDYDEDGEPLTLKFHLIGMAMLVVAQDQERRLAELERLVADRDTL